MAEPRDDRLVREVRASQFRRRLANGVEVVPRVGRFYPRNMVADLEGFFSADRRPLRCLANDGDVLRVDLNHPLCAQPIDLEICLGEILPGKQEHGGQANDVAH